MKKLIVSLVIATLVLGGTAYAGTLQKSDVSATAKWVLHLDLEKYHGSQIGQLLDQCEKKPHRVEGEKFLKDTLGIDPEKDLKSFTLYGESYKDGDGVVIIRLNASQVTIINFLNQNDTLKETAYAGKTIYNWTDKKKNEPAVGCFYDAQTILLAKTDGPVKDAIEVLNKSKASMADASFDLSVPEPSADVILICYARECEGKLSKHSKGAMAGIVNSIAFAVAESQGKVQLELEVGGASVEKTNNIEAMIKGMLAFTMLGAERNPKMAELAQLISVKTDGKLISVGLACTVEEIDAFIKAKKQKEQEMRAGYKKHGGKAHWGDRGRNHNRKPEKDNAGSPQN